MLVLASASPRRRSLLERLGLPLAVRPVEVDERPRDDEGAEYYLERITEAKAHAARQAAAPGELLLVADTIVVTGGEILGKPRDRDQALSMLRRLSGAEHAVLTAFWVGRAAEEPPPLQVTRTAVRFKTLSPGEMEWYLDTGEWKDKAGGYAIQERAAFMVAELRGSYTNVVGLPLAEVVEALRAYGLEVV